MNTKPLTRAAPTRDELENEIRKLRKINQVLMDRVERNMDDQGGSAFSLFQTAITLDARVSERTDELTRLTQRLMHEIAQRRETEKLLLIAKAEAEQAHLGKTHFLAAASHDLHQPLSAARLFLGTLAGEVEQGRTRDLVGRVEVALETVRELIDAVLDISKLDSGAWVVEPASFSIAPLLAGLADEYGPQAAAHGLVLRVVPSSAFVRTDRVLFRRAMSNLISNAIRYTKTGRILVGCRRRNGRICVEVWDTGIGIREETRSAIFEEFRQIGNPARSQEKGFGLGLAIVDRIVRLLALDIDVRSRVGHGSCFALSVPGGNSDEVLPEPVFFSGQTAGRPFAGLHVACVGSDPNTLDVLATLLPSWGAHPVVANGLHAIQNCMAFEQHGPDLIVADDHLDGGARGGDAILALRQTFGRAIAAIVVSGDRSAARRKAVEALGCGFLTKPLQPAKLRAMIGHLLDQGPAE